MSEEVPKEIRITGTFSLFIIFNICFKEATQMRKDLIIFLGHTCFLEITAFFLHAEEGLVRIESMANWGCQHWVIDIPQLPYTFESQWAPTLWIHQNSVPLGHWKGYMQMGWQRIRVNMHVACTSSAHTPTPLSHCTLCIKYKVKNKIIKNFSTVTKTHHFWA